MANIYGLSNTKAGIYCGTRTNALFDSYYFQITISVVSCVIGYPVHMEN